MLILASASPRRAELLTAAGYSFTVQPVQADERLLPDEAPCDAVARLSRLKADELDAAADAWVLAADTLVVVDGEALGKPTDAEDAAAMLRRLNGRAHEVVTGVTARRGMRVLTDVVETRVRMDGLDEDAIAWYVASGEPMDKAGAYGIQGLASRFVTRIEGSYTSVVGLPVEVVARQLRQLGYQPG
jgi:septum formation protein